MQNQTTNTAMMIESPLKDIHFLYSYTSLSYRNTRTFGLAWKSFKWEILIYDHCYAVSLPETSKGTQSNMTFQ